MKSKQVSEFKEPEIGKIPSDWEIRKLEELIFIKGRIGWKGLKKSEFTKEGIIIINGPQIKNGKVNWNQCLRVPKWRHDESKEISVKKGDILMTKDGTIGKMGYIRHLPESATLASGIFLIRSNSEKLDQRFLYYYFNSKFFNKLVESRIEGSVIPHLYQRDIIQLSIPLPSISEQQSIVKIIFDINSKIENLQNQNKILEQIVQGLFKSWFVDFDGQTEFINSKLGKIPKGWNVVPFKEMANCIKGFSYKGIEKFNEPRGYEFVTLNSIKEGGGFKKKFRWLESERLKERHFVKEMDLIIANTEQTKDARLLSTPALVQFSYDYDQSLAVFSHHITKIEPKIQHSKFYLYSFFLFYQQNIANAYHSGTGVWGFDHSNFENNYLMLKPADEILEKFEKITFELHTKIIENDKLISLLTYLSDILLPKLMSGEIRV